MIESGLLETVELQKCSYDGTEVPLTSWQNDAETLSSAFRGFLLRCLRKQRALPWTQQAILTPHSRCLASLSLTFLARPQGLP